VANVGAKIFTVSIISIVSTQVASQLHQTQTREGQLDTLLRGNLSVFYWEIEGSDDIVISYQLQLLSGFHYYSRLGIGRICDLFLVRETPSLSIVSILSIG